MTTPTRVRLATADDLPAIRAIYDHYVLTSTCTFQTEPRGDEEQRLWLMQHSPEHYPVTVAEDGHHGTVVGWGSLSPWNPRQAYARTAEASIYVRHDLRRRGVGRALLADLIARAKAAGHHVLIGGACTEQHESMALQESLGMVRVALFCEVGFKFGRWLDVAYYQLILSPRGG
jgi:phosphinothricin acetyltransferase